MPDQDMTSVGTDAIEKLSANVLNVRFGDLDEKTVEETKNIIIDVMGCIVGGSTVPDCVALAELVRGWGGKEEASIVVHGFKVPAHNAAMVNCIMGRSFDFEPVVFVLEGKRYPPHMSGTTGPTAITMGERQKVDGKELITALVVGNDITARIVAATTHPWHVSAESRMGMERARATGGFEPWGTVNAFGAAAIAGRLLGLNHSQLKNALGIVVNMMSGAGAGIWHGSPIFKLSQGTSARNGIFAAELAGKGWVGLPDPLCGRGCYYDTFTVYGCDHPEVLTKDLGRKFYYDTVFKPYPGGRPTHAPIDAALAIVHKHNVDADEIEEITLLISSADKYGHYWKPFEIREYPMCDALFSYRYAVATALLKKRVNNENFTEQAVRDPKVQSLIQKVKLGDLPKERGVELIVRLKDGREFSEYVEHAKGEYPDTLSRKELIDKFMMQAEFCKKISRENVEQLIYLIEHLEEVEDVSELVRLTCA
jgi:2-methylcitrate dehydratase PrpD